MATDTRERLDQEPAVAPGASTGGDLELSVPRAKRARAARRVLLVLFAALVVAGAVGVLGVRSATVRTTADGATLSVTYPRIARPGLAAPFEIEVASERALPDEVTISVSADYLAIFDENGLDPQPTEATSDAEALTWVVQPTPGAATVTVSYDARIEPGLQWPRSGEVRVRAAELPDLRVSFTSIVLP